MNTKKRFLLTLLIAIMCITMITCAIACEKDADDNTDDTTNDQLFTNGDFTLTTGDSYPLTPGSWTSSTGSSSAPSGSDNITAGVIDTSSSSFKDNKKTYGSIDNPGKTGDDDKILMIYNKTATSYKYTSASITLAKNAYYELSFSVKTLLDDDSDKAGAYVYLTGDAYAEFEAIDTNGEWKTYKIYIESSNTGTSSISLILSAGFNTTYTKGHVFFDSVVLTNLTDVEEGETAYSAQDFANQEVNEFTAKYSIIGGDKEFDYASVTSTTTFRTPSKYTDMTGSGSGDSAPSSSSYLEKGIVDTAEDYSISLGDSAYTLSVADGSVGNNILVINNKKATAYGYRSSVSYRFFSGKYYAVSVNVRTDILEGNGATLKLTNGTDTDERNIIINNINTSGAWQTYTFFIKGNDKRNNDLYLELWLGQGGSNDTATHVQGIASFDKVTYKEIDEAAYNSGVNRFSLESTHPAEDVNINDFVDTTYDETIASDRSQLSVADGVMTINNILPTAITVSNFTKNASDQLDNSKGLTIYPNNYYLLSVMFKTEVADTSKGLSINLISYNKDGTEYSDSFSTLASMSSLNTLNLEDYKIDDDYTEAIFYIKGSEYESNIVGLQFTLGSGKGTQSSSHVIGKAMIKDITVEVITPSEYNAASTSTVTKTASFSESSDSNGVSSNGEFKIIDAAATTELYETDVFTAQGKLYKHLGVPTNWTITQKTAITNGNSRAGVLDLESPELMSEMGLTSANFFDGYDCTDNPTVLAINSIDSTAIGYSSNSISLASNSYYMFSVWAKSDGSPLSIELATKTASGDENNKYYNINPSDNQWKQYFIYVETGISSVSVKLTLYSGNPQVSSNTQNGWVFFDSAKYISIDETTYKQGCLLENSTNVNVLAQSWLVDSFDSTTTSESLTSPENWSGKLLDSSAQSDSEYLAAGVFDQTCGDWSNIDIDPDTDTTVANAIFDQNKNIGDSVLVIYNKKPTSYQYTSSSTTLKADTYYKISIWLLTYGLDKDDSATLMLTLNNQTYTFGKLITDKSTEYDKTRQINTSTYDENGVETIGTWTEYSFYVKTEEDVTATASVTISLGRTGEEKWLEGYVFADNFSVSVIDESEFIARKPVEGETEETIDETLIDDALVANNFRIVFTEESADAEEDLNAEEEETEEESNTNDYLWLWITSGIVGGVIVIVLVVVLIKRFAPKKKKRSLTKKKSSKITKNNDKFSD
ncbi:MAG: hypothetical protein ACI4MI_01935 [Christensenellales bacterium]